MLNGSTPPVMLPYEPDLQSTGHGYRIYLSDFAPGAPPIETAGVPSLGPNSAYRPFFFVDINDEHIAPCDVAGMSAAGGVRCLFVTITARGRTRLIGSDPNVGSEFRSYHEGAAEMRAYVNLGSI